MSNKNNFLISLLRHDVLVNLSFNTGSVKVNKVLMKPDTKFSVVFICTILNKTQFSYLDKYLFPWCTSIFYRGFINLNKK